jgi:hypothetical protein
LRPTTRIFVFQLNTCGYRPYLKSSLTTGWVCRLQLLMVLVSAVILRSESRGTLDHILLSPIRDSPNLEAQVPVYISPRIRATQLYPPALGSLSFASCDSQGYGGDIRTRFGTDPMKIKSIVQQWMFYCCHARLSGQEFTAMCIATSTERMHREHCFYCCVFVAKFLLRRCLAKFSICHNTLVECKCY